MSIIWDTPSRPAPHKGTLETAHGALAHGEEIRHDAHEACQAWQSTVMGKHIMGGTKGALS